MSSTPTLVPGRSNAKQNVLHESFRYTLNKRRGERSYWRCVDKLCPGKINLKDDSIVVSTAPHNHLPTPAENSIHIAKQHLKQRACQSNAIVLGGSYPNSRLHPDQRWRNLPPMGFHILTWTSHISTLRNCRQHRAAWTFRPPIKDGTYKRWHLMYDFGDISCYYFLHILFYIEVHTDCTCNMLSS